MDKWAKLSIFGQKNENHTNFTKNLTSIKNVKNIHIRIAQIVYNNYMRQINITAIKNATVEEINNIFAFGDVMSESVVEYFKNQNNLKIISSLFESGVVVNEYKLQKSQKLSSLTFVLTGTLPTLSREDATKIIEDNGGRVTSSVSKNTDFILLGAEPGSKYDKGLQLGIKMISEQDLLKMVE